MLTTNNAHGAPAGPRSNLRGGNLELALSDQGSTGQALVDLKVLYI